MYLVIGLGNPEEEYNNTRHNMGFNVINKIAKKNEISISRNKFEGLYGDGIIENNKIMLIKPQTYMNLSGKSIKQYIDFYKIDIDDIIVIYDDIDIDTGVIKIRKNGGPGTHNGMKSVVHELGTDQFARIRVGIGAPKYDEDLINYVIGHIPEEEKEILDKGVEQASEAVIEIIKNGIECAMNRFN